MSNRLYPSLVLVVVSVLAFAITVPGIFSFVPQRFSSAAVAQTPDAPPFETNALVTNRVPHPACPNCFKVAGENRYGVYEEIPETKELIFRLIPDPAPLAPGEVRPDFDYELGEKIWFIGDQAMVGPTDEEPVSAELPMSRIELMRIKSRHTQEMFRIRGVHGVAIDAKGFRVFIEPKHQRNATKVPAAIEGIPVTVQVLERFELTSHEGKAFDGIPSGARIEGIGSGTVGPHIVRNGSDMGFCCKIWSLTAGHVVKHLGDTFLGYDVIRVYQPTVASSRQFGFVEHTFTLSPCTSPDCINDFPSNTNPSFIRPDVAAIAHANGHFHTDGPRPAGYLPVGVEPIRKMYQSPTAFTNGPSGRIASYALGSSFKYWSSNGGTEGVFGTIDSIGATIAIRDTDLRQYCLTDMDVGRLSVAVLVGDSGALVARESLGQRDIFGVQNARPFVNQGQPNIFSFSPAVNVKQAFSNANLSFHHYWGTAKDSATANYREPATDQCDGGC